MLTIITNLPIVVIIGVTCVIPLAVRGCPYNTPECTCDVGTIRCVGLQEMPPLDTRPNMFPYLGVIFSDGSITSIPKTSFPNYVFGINLIRLPLTNISDDAFDNLATTLRQLAITGAQFKKLPGALLKLTNLTSLSIKDMPIESWDGSILEHLATMLSYLSLINVGLTTWPSWISNFHLLQALDLSGNLLKGFPADAFSSFNDSLTGLKLGSTGLTHVPQVLSTLPNLVSLDLSGNVLVDVFEIEKLALSPFGTQLSTLSILSIGLTSILNFSNFTSLTTIHLDNNNISDYEAGSFPPSVTELSLAGNHLSSVPTVIASMSNLTLLNLARNQISEIQPDTFPSNIDTLDLSYNKFAVITNTTFTNLSLLFQLYLSNNPISSISLWAFADLISLDFLYLDATSLTEIPLALKNVNKYTLVSLVDIASLPCPCPSAAQDLRWYQPGDSVPVQCHDGETVYYYLISGCTLPSTPAIPTTPSDHAPGLEFSLLCRYGLLLLVLFFSINVDDIN